MMEFEVPVECPRCSGNLTKEDYIELKNGNPITCKFCDILLTHNLKKGVVEYRNKTFCATTATSFRELHKGEV